MKSRLLSLAALGFLLTTAVPAPAWDLDGHKITARIAFDRLTPDQQSRLRAELASLRLGVEATASKIEFEFRVVGAVEPSDRWSVTAP